MKTPNKQPVEAGKIHFSVVIPLFNKETTIERAIRSVLDQTMQAFEIIVVNDGSTDNGQKVVESIDDDRICLIQQANQGVSAARNRGIAEAGHDLVAFLDADDEWLPGFLETIRRLVADYPHCAAYATRYLFGLPDGRTRPCVIRGLPDGFFGVLEDYFKIAARSDPPICSSSVVVKKTAINAVGGFPVGITSGEDLLTWARVAAKYKIAYSTQPRAVFYVPANISDRPGRFANTNDIVGKSLADILTDIDHSAKLSLQKYIALWYKMRTISLFMAGNKREALKHYRARFLFSVGNSQFVCYKLLEILPIFFIKFVIRFIRIVKRKMS